ncbi:MAG: hypothetical protein K2O91_11765 [Lachnospiraceae bacterium]|nr:hypothetical protein [Lachnospiraceae bacterium]
MYIWDNPDVSMNKLGELFFRDAEVASSNLVATTLGRGAGILGFSRVPVFFIIWLYPRYISCSTKRSTKYQF